MIMADSVLKWQSRIHAFIATRNNCYRVNIFSDLFPIILSLIILITNVEAEEPYPLLKL